MTQRMVAGMVNADVHVVHVHVHTYAPRHDDIGEELLRDRHLPVLSYSLTFHDSSILTYHDLKALDTVGNYSK